METTLRDGRERAAARRGRVIQLKAQVRASVFIGCLALGGLSLEAQLFTNLQSFGTRLDAGDPSVSATFSEEGPKGLATADFDSDGEADLVVANTDGTVTLYYGLGGGRFAPPDHLQTGVEELRGIVAADVTADGRPDIAVAAPYEGRVFLFVNQSGHFGSPASLAAWPGARNLAAGDFDGDGRLDLAVAGTTNGLEQWRSEGAGGFTVVTNLPSLGTTHIDFPKPVYSMAAFRPVDATKDELAVAHADGDLVWVLSAGADGNLAEAGRIMNQRIHALDVGTIAQPRASGAMDLVTASRDLGYIEVHRGTATPERFEQQASQRIDVPGGPRAVQIVDLDADGWNDLVVALRNFDRVLTYHNSNGVLVAGTEMTVGLSPRELVSARFNGDVHPDVAVMNRDSQDISVLLTFAGQAGFAAFDQIYPVDGEVSGLQVLDFNRDGRDDVVQLHRASAEFSVRLAETNGLLAAPTFFPMGSLPSAQATVDVDGDGIADMVTANLGNYGLEPGSVSVRLGDGQGGFGPEQRYYLPPETGGSLFALVAADFDKDGHVDLAAGFFDCRLAFFKGHGDGSFTFTRAHLFVYESRVMVTGDFDQDGDIDLAGAGYAGDVVVIENTGDLLTTETLARYEYKAPSEKKFGTRDIVTADVNNDGDPDLIVGSGDGAMLFLGAEGMAFIRAADKLPGTDFPASSVALGDFDGNGTRDVAISCRLFSCVSILSLDTNGQYQPSLSVDVPSGEFLATGDLDGDGYADLVGSGSVLWTALSSKRPQLVQPKAEAAARAVAQSLVINEVLAINTEIPVDQDGDRFTDWIELYNGTASSVAMAGWRVRLTTDEGGALGTVTNTFTFPPTAFFARNAHMLLFFSETRRTPYHTGFRLPGAGGVLSLVNPAGVEVDRVGYPGQQENVSYGRFKDGAASFVFNPYPTTGRENTDNGPVEPEVRLEDFNLINLQPGQPIRFDATGQDDVGIISLTLLWQRLDQTNAETHRIVLYDDAMHEDGGLLDNHFSGLLEEPLPEGAEIQFYVEAIDLSGRIVILPDEPIFARMGDPIRIYSLAVSTQGPAIEISEVVASNLSGLKDELGDTPDWVEIRNCSDQPVPLGGMALTTRFFRDTSRLEFLSADVLLPGEHRVIFCDNHPERGPAHAPFVLNRDGDQLLLTGTAPQGARQLLNSVVFGLQPSDVAWARLGCEGGWDSSSPTPRGPNVAGAWLIKAPPGGAEVVLAYPTATNRVYIVEATDSLSAPQWTPRTPVPGTGTEQVFREPMRRERYFRVSASPRP